MSFDAAEFEKEVDIAIESQEVELKDDSGDAEVKEKEASDGGQSDAKAVEDEASVDDKDREGEGGEVDGDDDGDGERSSEKEGDKEGSGDSEEESSEGKKEVEKKGISDYAIEQAVAVGVPLGDAVAFKSDESLLRVVEARRLAAVSIKGVGSEVDKKEEASDLEDLISKIPDLDPEEFTPETVAMFGALKDIITQQQDSIREISQQQTAAADARLATTAEEVEGWFDSEVSNLGEDFAEALGTGGYSSLLQGSPQLAKRDEIATQVLVLNAGYAAIGAKTPPRAEVFKIASQFVLQKEFEQIKTKKVTGELSKRSKQHLQRGSGKKNKSQVSPEEEIAAELDQKYPTR